MLKFETVKIKMEAKRILSDLKKNHKKREMLESILDKHARSLEKELRDNGFGDIADISLQLKDMYLDDLKAKYL